MGRQAAERQAEVRRAVQEPPDLQRLKALCRVSEGAWALSDFRLESGAVLRELRIGYVAFGDPDASGRPLLLVLPGTGNTRYSALGHVGPGRAYDTDRYCVVCTDAIGGGLSSQPADGEGMRFPTYTVRDMVHAQRAAVERGLGLRQRPVDVLAGASMGAFQTLEWLIHYPGTVRSAVLLVPGWRAGPLLALATARMFDFVALDARWNGGQYREQPLAGLQAAGRHYFPWTVSDAYLEETPWDRIEAEAAASGEWFAQWDAWNLVRRYQASTRHDVCAPFGGRLEEALARVDARVLVVPCRQDRLLGLRGAEQIAEGIGHARFAPVDSAKGHLAWRAVPGSPQTQAVTRHVREFLGLEASAPVGGPPQGAAGTSAGEG